jgi:hypothetical protein
MLHSLAKPAGPGRLQPCKDADGLDQRGLALGVRAHEDVHPRHEIAIERFEAPEMANGEVGEHGSLFFAAMGREGKRLVLYRRRPATAFAFRVAVEAARAWIQARVTESMNYK